jgi:fermentation-respiration switch protein FrsA (DUF1100 family)
VNEFRLSVHRRSGPVSTARSPRVRALLDRKLHAIAERAALVPTEEIRFGDEHSLDRDYTVAPLFELRGPPLPYRLLLTDQFDSEALIGGIGVPVMILHGTADESVPVTEARRLYAAAHEPKTMIEVGGAGHLAAWEGGAKGAGARGARHLDRAEAAAPSGTGGRLRHECTGTLGWRCLPGHVGQTSRLSS